MIIFAAEPAPTGETSQYACGLTRGEDTMVSTSQANLTLSSEYFVSPRFCSFASIARSVSSKIACLVIAFVLTCAAARAQVPAPLPTPTPVPNPAMAPPSPCAKKNKTLSDNLKCLKSYYDKVTSKQGFHLVTGNVVPGSGLTGGVGYSRGQVGENWSSQFDSSARVSVKKYWELDSNLRLTRVSTNSFSDDEGFGALKINLYGLIKDAPRLDFFGIGPESRLQDRAVFHYREAVGGVDFAKPMRSWLTLGGAAELISPDIIRIANPTVRSVERVYTEATLPGITSQPLFLHFVAFAGIHSSSQKEARSIEYTFFFHGYRDLQRHSYSFRRFDADLRHKFPFGKNQIRMRGRVSLSGTSGGQRVPFYLMETLGGSNIRSDESLRGFRDYRFRDRDFLLLQTEYLREVSGPVDFIAFYDTGKVASSISHFGDGRLRHTFGLGLVVVPRRLDNVLFRFYVALGSGEGSHTYLGGGLPSRADRLTR
ncbi:MAG TPA: hypothetical protein DC047_11045 [Blastocatellia bacterium]|nr:hypothetical protein [Blastocatellia bacterium]